MKNLYLFSTLKNRALGASLLATVIMVTNADAQTYFTRAEVPDQHSMLLATVKQGDELWHSPTLGANGLACSNCHPDGSAIAPQTWPKYQANLSKVGTLREMINWCITVPMLGQALPLESDEMIAIEAYATQTHRDVAITLNKDEQYDAVPVFSSAAYPNANGDNRQQEGE